MSMPLKKIVLKNSTSLSLNERFTFLRQQNERVAAAEPMVLGRVDTMRQARANLQRASAKNRRLALQMENRPAVAAALRIKKRNIRQQRQNMTGTSQQGASSVKERLTLSARARLGWRGRGSNLQRGGRGMRGAIQQQQQQQMRGRGGFRRPQNNMMRTGGTFRARGGAVMTRGGRGLSRGGYVQRGGRNMNVQGGFSPRGFNARRGGQRGVNFGARGGRQQRGGTRGRQQRGQRRPQRRGAQGQRNPVIPTKDELDTQLDEYMAGTKAHLDRELDQYMNIQV